MMRNASSRKVTTIRKRPKAGRWGLMGCVYWSIQSSTLEVYSRTFWSGDSESRDEENPCPLPYADMMVKVTQKDVCTKNNNLNQKEGYCSCWHACVHRVGMRVDLARFVIPRWRAGVNLASYSPHASCRPGRKMLWIQKMREIQ